MDETELRRAVLEGYAVEAAYTYALWLEAQGRLEHAARLLEAALREGPDFGKRGELACVTLLEGLEAAWKRVHEKRGVAVIPGGAIYNAGVLEPVETDWAKVLADIRA